MIDMTTVIPIIAIVFIKRWLSAISLLFTIISFNYTDYNNYTVFACFLMITCTL